jgi:poly-gamma-glutamate synthesis protein (capsule biosynthesis protein)
MPQTPSSARAFRLLLCGDVMTGRGIDQLLPNPGAPALREDYLHSAKDYVRLGEAVNGPVHRPIGFDEPWGAAREIWGRMAPDARIMNLETAVTTCDSFAPKGINYRMHPDNLPCLAAAAPDVLTLANNHVLDFGRRGLEDTLKALHAGGLNTAGAGRDLVEAAAPAAVVLGPTRLLVHALAASDSGVPASWSATAASAGVAHTELGEADAERLVARIRNERAPGELAMVSIHWGSNWGYEVAGAHERFAHALIDSGEVALVHGHSSHHPRPIEIYRERLILYGCGDLLNDYEGIGGYEAFRSELVMLYFADLDRASGALLRLQLAPLRIHRFRLVAADRDETDWLAATLSRESRRFGVQIVTGADRVLEARWRGATQPQAPG